MTPDLSHQIDPEPKNICRAQSRPDKFTYVFKDNTAQVRYCPSGTVLK